MSEPKQRIGQFFIEINGSDLAEDVIGRLDDALIEDDLAQPAMFMLRFHDPKLDLIDGDQFRLGAEVKLGAADVQGKRKRIIVGEITSIEPLLEQHNLTLTVRGYDRSHRLHRGTKTRTFLKQTDDDMVKKIAADHGLRADAEPTKERHEYIVQDNQSDMVFLRERAARLGFQIMVEDKTLHFRRADKAPKAAPDLEWGVNLLSFRTRLTAVAQPSTVQVRGWDALAKAPIVGQATRASQPSKIGDGQTGGSAADKAFESNRTLVITDRLVLTKAEADQYAQATLDDQSGDYLTAEGRCLGAPELRAGCIVKIDGVGKRLGGTYFITATRHEYTATEGFMTTFYASGHRPTSMLSALEIGTAHHASMGVVTGIVTNANDPQKLGRVKVAFKWLDDKHETDWARVVTPGAGPSRGFLVTPEVDDEVLIAFEHGDFGRPYVVGGLWNTKDKPPTEAVKGGKIQTRTITTRAGHSITLRDDDNAGQIEIKTKKHTALLDDSGSGKVQITTGKHTITLDDTGVSKVMISSGGDIEFEGKGGKLSITASGVVLEGKGGKLNIAASGVELSSQTNLKVQANAMLDVKTSAMLTIQGSLVKIN